MSLIFEALKRTNAASGPGDAGLMLADAPGAPVRRAWAAAAVGLCCGALLATGFWWTYRSGEAAGRSQAPPPPATAPALSAPLAAPASAPASVTASAAVLAPVSAPASVPAPASTLASSPVPAITAATTPAAVSAKAPAAAPAGAPAASAAALAAVPAPVPAPLASADARPASSPAGSGMLAATASRAPAGGATLQVSGSDDSYDARAAFQSFLHQVQAQQWNEARRTRDAMQAALGPEHVLTLRVQGYLALRQNELDSARQSYRKLLERLPDDREGGLNLALIDWRSGDKDAARKRVGVLLDKFPQDGEIKALAQNIRMAEGAW